MEKLSGFVAERFWLQLVLSVLCASAVIMLISPGESPAAVLLRVAVSSVGGVIVLVGVRRRERRAVGGSTANVLSLDRKLRTGEVPTEPGERRAMRDLVEQRLHRTRHRVTATVFLVLLCASVVVMTAVTSGLRGAVGITLFLVIFVGWLIGNGSVQDRRLRRMRDALGTSGTQREPGLSDER
ncbi:hypothetical protein [Streptomyces sp. NPDC007883]|uniref:hypothetical protein n=1 Tax=Streptomyces sp. NPDC007883 TaxID=3155116 RepID=UPI003407690C